MLATSSHCVLDRFSFAIGGLKKLVFDTHQTNGMTVPFIMMFQRWLGRLETRVQKLVAELRAGIIRPDPAPSPSARAPRGPGKPKPPEMRVPRGFAWLNARIPYKAAGFSWYLTQLLSDPEMLALVAASPRLERMLRPLCHMLALKMGSFRPMPAPAPAESKPVSSDWEDGGSLGNHNSLNMPPSPIIVIHGPPPAAGPRPDDPPSHDPPAGQFFATG